MKNAILILAGIVIIFFLLPTGGQGDKTENAGSRPAPANSRPVSGSLSTVASNHDLVLVDFWAPWCGPCRKMLPVVERIEKKYDVYVVRINVDERPDVAREYGVRGIPMFLVFKDGKQVDKITGAVPEERLTLFF